MLSELRTWIRGWPSRHDAGARHRLVLCALILSALVSTNARAGELEELNPGLAAQVHLKALAYDRNLQTRAKGRLVLAILYRPDREESERARAAMQSSFQERAARSSLRGLPLTVTTVPLGDPRTLLKRLQEAGATLLYVTPGLEDTLSTITSAAVTLQAPTLTGRRELLNAGLALAVVTDGEKPVIVVNLPPAKAIGMDFDPALLRLAEVKR